MARKTTFFYCQKDAIKKKYHDRSGGLLILVIVIMAVALILITSALTITVAARRHYYDNALSSQTRLTSASAAKTITEAIMSGNIRDAEIQALADEGLPVVIYSASATDSTATKNPANTFTPGLKGDEGTSRTTVTFSYYPTGTHDSTATYIMGKVETTLGLPAGDNVTPSTDTVVFLLQKKPVTPIGDAFSNVITMGTDGSPNTLTLKRMFVGQLSGFTGTPASNYVVIHGKTTLSGSDLTVNSDIIITNQVTFSEDADFMQNMILAGDSASINKASGGGPVVYGDLIAFGDNLKSLFTDSAGAYTDLDKTIGGFEVKGSIFLVNKKISIPSSYTNSHVIQVGSSGDNGIYADKNSIVEYLSENMSGYPNLYRDVTSAQVTTRYFEWPNIISVNYPVASPSGARLTSLSALAAKYQTPQVQACIARQIPSTSEALAKVGLSSAGSTLDSIVAYTHAEKIPTTNFKATGNVAGSPYTATPLRNSFYIDVSSSNVTLGTGLTDGQISHLTFDLSGGSITLYIIGGNTLVIDSGLIEFKNGFDTTNVGTIVLLNGADISMTVAWEHGGGDCGIIGSAHMAGTGTQTIYVPNTKPFLYIYGTGNNKIFIEGSNNFLEGYVGLYGPAGTIEMVNQVKIYGRLEATTLTGNSGDINIPYCPSPTESVTSSTTPIPVTSIYQVVGYITM